MMMTTNLITFITQIWPVYFLTISLLYIFTQLYRSKTTIWSMISNKDFNLMISKLYYNHEINSVLELMMFNLVLLSLIILANHYLAC